MGTAKRIVSIATREATLKRKFRRHLQELGFTKGQDGALEFSGSGKDRIRARIKVAVAAMEDSGEIQPGGNQLFVVGQTVSNHCSDG
jgi:hypothetical protein